MTADTTSKPPFNPNDHLIAIRRGGPADYLPVAFRLVWLRERHPDAVIETEMVSDDKANRIAVFKATITIPGGGKATGHKSESHKDFPDGHYEKAETGAIGRALIALGFGAENAGEEFNEAAIDRNNTSANNAASTEKAGNKPVEQAAQKATRPKETPEQVVARMEAALGDKTMKLDNRIAAASWLFKHADSSERLQTLWKITQDVGLKEERITAAYTQNAQRLNPAYAG